MLLFNPHTEAQYESHSADKKTEDQKGKKKASCSIDPTCSFPCRHKQGVISGISFSLAPGSPDKAPLTGASTLCTWDLLPHLLVLLMVLRCLQPLPAQHGSACLSDCPPTSTMGLLDDVYPAVWVPEVLCSQPVLSPPLGAPPVETATALGRQSPALAQSPVPHVVVMEP